MEIVIGHYANNQDFFKYKRIEEKVLENKSENYHLKHKRYRDISDCALNESIVESSNISVIGTNNIFSNTTKEKLSKFPSKLINDKTKITCCHFRLNNNYNKRSEKHIENEIYLNNCKTKNSQLQLYKNDIRESFRGGNAKAFEIKPNSNITLNLQSSLNMELRKKENNSLKIIKSCQLINPTVPIKKWQAKSDISEISSFALIFKYFVSGVVIFSVLFYGLIVCIKNSLSFFLENEIPFHKDNFDSDILIHNKVMHTTSSREYNLFLENINPININEKLRGIPISNVLYQKAPTSSNQIWYFLGILLIEYIAYKSYNIYRNWNGLSSFKSLK